ncbi:MAG: pentapeptide repeat-containing protein [Ardenticatenaceae bacterium]|nr:pentapeptide repeat-containing protein [Ardenticatenaceae bacterium]
MHNARLWHSDLSTGQMHYANFEGADLRVANLREAELKGANLRNTRLKLADLRGCLLTDADFTGADLEQANLAGSNITLAQIQSAKTLAGAIMPDGTFFEQWHNQPEPITLAKRKLELDKFNSEWFSKPAVTPRQGQSMSLLWVGVGLGTAVMILMQQIWKLFRQRSV